MNNLIIRYPKDSNKNKIGCFISMYDEDNKEATVGWSVYNSKKEEKPFDKYLAKVIAGGRLNKGSTGARFPDYMEVYLYGFIGLLKHKLGENININVIGWCE